MTKRVVSSELGLRGNQFVDNWSDWKINGARNWVNGVERVYGSVYWLLNDADALDTLCRKWWEKLWS